MTASIVINTYNRARSLERLLPSLLHLDGAEFEVVVVNGPSTDDTLEVLARYNDRLKVAACPVPNLSRSRNIGIAEAAGDVVLFLDDDALPGDRGWLQRILDTFAADDRGRVGAVGGASMHRDTEWPEFSGGWTSDYADQIFNDGPLPEGADPARWCRRTVGNNSAFRRSALVAIGGFDERFAYYLDEADVCFRLVRAGFDVIYRTDCPVRHYPAASPHGAPFIRNRRIIARSDTYYCLKNGADRLVRRVARTVAKAPHKHFVAELPGLVADGRITAADLWRLRLRWLIGVVEGLALGLGPRRTASRMQTPPAFRAFRGASGANRQLSVCLLSRRLPPDPHAGGIGRYTYDLARGLHALGHRVTIITESPTPLRREGLDFDVVGVVPAAPPAGLSQMPVLADNLLYAQAVRDVVHARLDAGDPFDVVHASTWGFEGLGLAQAGRVPLTVMLVTPLECIMRAEGWALTEDLAANIALDQWTIDHAARVCAPSTGVLASYRERDQWTERLVHTTPLGIATTALAPPDVDASAATAADLDTARGPASATGPRSGEPKRLLFVGRLERRKGIHQLLSVLPGLLVRHPDWTCDLVGHDPEQAPESATYASRFQAAHAGARWLTRVRFHGACSDADVQAFYRSADVFVAPSLFESFGLIYLEAMQYGVPVVGGRVGGVPEVVAEGSTGLLVDSGQPAALEAALDRLMTDGALRAQMGARSASYVHTTRTHIAMAERLVDQYCEATADRRHGAVTSRAGDAWPQTNLPEPSVFDRALPVLEARTSTRGIGLAFRAAAAFELGHRDTASALIATALGVSRHPDYFALALELAVARGDAADAWAVAANGFAAASDDSDTRLVFGAALLAYRDRANAGGMPSGWDPWYARHAADFATRAFQAAVSAIRSRRDGTAIVLLQASLVRLGDPRMTAQARYHLGSALKRQARPSEARAVFEHAFVHGEAALLPLPIRAALHFHAGELDEADGRVASAIDRFAACVAIEPSHRRARAALDRLTASRVSDRRAAGIDTRAA